MAAPAFELQSRVDRHDRKDERYAKELHFHAFDFGAYRRMTYVGGAWKESKELDVRAKAFQLISIFNWAHRSSSLLIHATSVRPHIEEGQNTSNEGEADFVENRLR